jgi:hypothetical protein
MGNVFFDTDVNKTVDIFKTVDLLVTKDVSSVVDLTGNLATAEASADAVGGTGGGSGTSFPAVDFIIDTYDTDAEVIGGADPGNEERIRPFVVTDIPSGNKDVTVLTISGNNDQNVARALDVPDGMGGIVSRGQFSSEVSASADYGIVYSSGGAGDPFNNPFDGNDEVGAPFVIVPADRPGGIADCLFTAEAVINDLGTIIAGDTAPFTPVELAFTDADGDRASVNLALEAIAPFGVDVEIPLAAWLGGPDVEQPGNSFEFADEKNPLLDFDAIVAFEIIVRGEFDFDGDGTEEINTAFDIQVDNIVIECPEIRRGGGGNLAETDTFAQVTEDGAFSFSESLAAFDPFEIA